MKDVKTPLEAFCYWEDKTPNSIFLSQPIIGKWRTWTYREAGLEARTVAAAIGKFNLPERSNIAILSKNCAEWILADLAIWMAGHVSVPIFSTVTSPALKKMLHHSEARILFVGKLDAFEAQVEGIPDATVCISIDAYGINLGLRWTDIIKMNNSFSRVRTRFRG